METKVVNIKQEQCEVYIGRSSKDELHFGNPFSHKSTDLAYKVNTLEDSIQEFVNWLQDDDTDIEPERRKWILENIPNLKGKRLGCFCKPSVCHGDILAALTEGESLENIQKDLF